MKLNFDKLKEITTGAVDFYEENGMFSPKRFTREQENLYKETNDDFYRKAHASSGIKFLFKTDSSKLFIKIWEAPASSRKYFSLDVFTDGKFIGSLDNFSDMTLPKDYTKVDFETGSFSKEFSLGEGEKTVCVHLPWSAETLIEEFSVDDNAFVKGIKPEKKLLAFGDSITQGYDALRTSDKYTSLLAELLGAEEFNKGIGAERFFPELAKLKDPIEPDYITVAYGTNDWNGADAKTFKSYCRGFYKNLSENYPNSKIFAITPIWRKDMNEERKCGKFEVAEENIRNAVCDLENVVVIKGFDFVPHNEDYYADLRLHPNDEGFRYYAENLFDKIKTEI